MYFKNCSTLRLPVGYTLPEEIETAFAEHLLRSPGPLELETRGFLSPFKRDQVSEILAAMTHATVGCTLLTVGTDQRLLPTSVFRDAVNERIAEHEAKTGRKPGKRLRNEFREAVLGELLPRAFIKRARTAAYFDASSRLLVIDTTSNKTAEMVASAVRDALGTFPARPLATEASLSLLMSEWLVSGSLPAGFELGDEVQMKDPSGPSSTIRCTDLELGADEIREHARCGMQVTQLGLIFDGRIGFVLDTQMRLRKLSFFDVVAEQLDAQDGADPDQILDAEFALMSWELRRLYARLGEILRFVD